MRSTGTNIEQLGSGELYDPRSGTTYTLRYQGTTASILAQKALLQSLGYRVRYTPNEQGYDMLEAERSGADDADPNEPLSSLWYPKYNYLDRSVWDHPRVRRILNKFTNLEDRAGFRAMVLGFVSGELTSQHSTEPGNAISPDYFSRLVANKGGNLTDFQELLEALTKGVEIWPQFQQVLIHVMTVPSATNLRPSIVDIGNVFSRSRLISHESIDPALLKFDIPEGFFLKCAPEMDPSRADRWTITQEYLYVAETKEDVDNLVHPVIYE